VVPTKEGAAPRGGDQGRAQLVLNSASQLYNEIRGMSWPAVGPFLTRRAKTLRADVAEGRDVISGRDLKKMKALTSSKLTHIKVRGKGNDVALSAVLKGYHDGAGCRSLLFRSCLLLNLSALPTAEGTGNLAAFSLHCDRAEQGCQF
jgi:hypothetical protein